MTEITLPTLQTTTALPEIARVGGRSAGTNVYQQFMMDMPAPANGKGKGAPMQYAWFFVPSEVPDTITDEAEREKAAKANTSKLVNRFTSLSRRIRKNNSETHDFTFRKMKNDEGQWGLAVYRVPPGMDKGGPQKAAS